MTESQRDGVEAVLPAKSVHQRFQRDLRCAVDRDGLGILSLESCRSGDTIRSIGHDRGTEHKSAGPAPKCQVDDRHRSGDVHGDDATGIAGFDHEAGYAAGMKDQIGRRQFAQRPGCLRRRQIDGFVNVAIPACILRLQIEAADLPVFRARSLCKASADKAVGPGDQNGRH
jgi:hypothetical protein